MTDNENRLEYSLRWLRTQNDATFAQSRIPERHSVSGASSPRSDGVHRITASPHERRTKIAKISYTPQPVSATKSKTNPKEKKRPSTVDINIDIVAPPKQTDFTSTAKGQEHSPRSSHSMLTKILTPQRHLEQSYLPEYSLVDAKATREALYTENTLRRDSGCVAPLKDPYVQNVWRRADAESVSSRQYDDYYRQDSSVEVRPEHHESHPSSGQPSIIPTGDVKRSDSFRRSKTEFTLDRPDCDKVRRNNERTGSSRERSKSSHVHVTEINHMNEVNQRKKSYNPEVARRFMEEQKRKRRSNPALMEFSRASREKNAKIEKEAIKKRLEELERNTKKILAKNSKKKLTAAAIPAPAMPDPTLPYVKEENQNRQNVTVKKQKPGNQAGAKPLEATGDVPEKLQTQQAEDNANETHHTADPKASVIKNDLRLSLRSSASNPLMENQRRVGLLRKPDTVDPPFNGVKEFNFNKENVVRPRAGDSFDSQLSDKLVPGAPNQPKNAVAKEANTSCNEVPKNALSEDLKLVPPAMHLTCEDLHTPLSGEEYVEDLEKSKRDTDYPFWLKPIHTQTYPYSVIVAVRRKLEAITQPATPQAPEIPVKTICNIKHDGMRLPNTGEAPLAPVLKDRAALLKYPENRPETQLTKGARHVDCAHRTSSETTVSQSMSGLNSNLDSITLQIPMSHTTSEESVSRSHSILGRILPARSDLLRQDNTRIEDDTTASSSVFSSPKRNAMVHRPTKVDFQYLTPRPISPLSVAHVNTLKIQSKSTSKRSTYTESYSEEEQYEDKWPFSPQNRPCAHQQPAAVGVNFNKLLDDFNRSLSEVIRVNQQLKNTLDRSQQNVFGPKRHTVTKPADEYTTDFEESSHRSPQNTDTEQRLHTADASNHESNKPIKELTEAVNSPPKFELNLGSLANTSNSSVEEREDREEEYESEGSRCRALQNGFGDMSEKYELHLKEIEHLKLTLKQSIVKSKAARTDREVNTLESQRTQGSEEVIDVQSNNFEQLGLGDDCRTPNTETHRTEWLLPTHEDYSDCKSTSAATDNYQNKKFSAEGEQTSRTFSAELPPLVSASSYNSNTHSLSQKSSATPNKQMLAKISRSPNESYSSIVEELHEAKESASRSNESANEQIPNGHKSHSKLSVAQKSFVKSHVNIVRGDFSESSNGDDDLQKQPVDIATSKRTKSDTNAGMRSSVAVESVPPPQCRVQTAAVQTMDVSEPKAKNTHLVRKQSRSISSPLHSASSAAAQAIGKEILSIFDQTELELAASLQNSGSETSANYSSIGVYEKLIKTEATRSEHLTALLRMREKALLDRTKGQIAWLQIQKERYKTKGLVTQISAIKKKQRAILMKMEREREEIKRLLQSTSSTSTHTSGTQVDASLGSKNLSVSSSSPSTPRPASLLPFPSPVPGGNSGRSSQKRHQREGKNNTIGSVVRANYNLEPSRPVEELLQRREADLRKRRHHVEQLMQWHKRLDDEEAEVLGLERLLLNYNNVPSHQANEAACGGNVDGSSTAIATKQQLSIPQIDPTIAKSLPPKHKMERRLKEIDKSLRELSSISTQNDESGSAMDTAADFVRTTGIKLNKLWRRLTSQQVEKFEPSRRYKLYKIDLERLYEEAKLAVLKDFAQDEERVANELLDRSVSNMSVCTSKVDMNLEFESTPPSEAEGATQATATSIKSISQGNYHPSAAEEKFHLCNSATKNSPASGSSSAGSVLPSDRDTIIKRNVQKFLAITQQRLGQEQGLQRSLSDTQINNFSQPAFQMHSTKQRNVFISESCVKATSMQGVDSSRSSKSSQANSASLDTLNSVQSLRTATASGATGREVAAEEANIPSAMQYSEGFSVTLRTLQKYVCSPTHSPTKQSGNESSRSEDDSDSGAISASSANRTLLQSMRESSVIHTVGDATPRAVAWEGITAGMNQISSPPSGIASPEAADDLEEIVQEEIQQSSSESQLSACQASNVASPQSQISSERSLVEELTVESERKSQEISNKLEAISAAVAQLSQSNSLPSIQHTVYTDSKETIESNIGIVPSISSTLTPTLDGEDQNGSFSDSYTHDFEQAPTGTQSPSASSLEIQPQSNSNAPSVELNQSDLVPATTKVSPTTEETEATLMNISCETRELSKQFNINHLQNTGTDTYDPDFESSFSEVTRIEDISMPQFEVTMETTQDDFESCKEITLCPAAVENSPSAKHQETRDILPPPPPPQPSNSTTSTTNTSTIVNANVTAGSTQLMPDIINELEIRRCQQILIENEHLKQYDHVTAVPYMYVREIPNKPPPPYVPPAHGSPMTTIFPSEDRIKDITFRRTQELYCEILKTDYINDKGEKLPSVMEEKITNIYERIVLDICREYLDEHQEDLTKGDPTNFHRRLAFFNPPNRLRCIQDSVYKEVRRCLAMDKTSPKRTQVYSVYGQRAKRDHIGKIIIQELYDEDNKWCNFHREENEVLELIFEEMIGNCAQELVKEVYVAEGGTLSEEVEEEIEENLCTSDGADTSEFLFEDVPPPLEITSMPFSNNVELEDISKLPRELSADGMLRLESCTTPLSPMKEIVDIAANATE